MPDQPNPAHLERQLASIERLGRLNAGVPAPAQLTLPISDGSLTRDTRAVPFLFDGVAYRTPSCFAVRYGSGSTTYRRSARTRQPKHLNESLAGYNEAVIRPFRGLEPRLIGWAAEGGRPGITIDAAEEYNDRDPFLYREQERADLFARLDADLAAYAAELRSVIYRDDARGAHEAARRLSALLADPWLQFRHVKTWFDPIGARRDPLDAWDSGGCGILALALRGIVGGRLVGVQTVYPPYADSSLDHVALELDGVLLDALGLQTHEAMLERWIRITEAASSDMRIEPLDEPLPDGFAATPKAVAALGDEIAQLLPEAVACLRRFAAAS